MSPLRNKALEKYRISPLVSWILGITFALLSASLVLLDIFLGFTSILFAIFIILPMFFSMLFLHIGLTYNTQVTAKNFFKYFALYFKAPYRGTFYVLSILWKAILIFFGVSLIGGLIATGVCRSINVADYNTMMDTLLEFIMGESSLTVVTLEELFGETYYLFEIYMLISTVPSTVIAVGFFIYFALRNALSVYLRINMRKASTMACTQIFNLTWRNKKELRQDYIRLQWPILVILVALPILTCCLSLLITKDYAVISSIGVASMLLGMGIYFPFYSANNEALWSKYEKDFKMSIYTFAQNSVNVIQKKMEMAENEREELEKALNDLKQHLEEETTPQEEQPKEETLEAE